MVGAFISLASVASAADAGENWGKSCASCHGKDGTGNTVMGKKNGAKDYTTAAGQAFSDAEAAKAIKEGVVGKMKPFADKLSDADIKALVAHIRAFKK